MVDHKKWYFSYNENNIDHAGKLVIPKDIDRESGIKPGMPLDVRWENGKIAITPAPLLIKLEQKGRLLRTAHWIQESTDAVLSESFLGIELTKKY